MGRQEMHQQVHCGMLNSLLPSDSTQLKYTMASHEFVSISSSDILTSSIRWLAINQTNGDLLIAYYDIVLHTKIDNILVILSIYSSKYNTNAISAIT